ncbi:hypothetical protein J2X45_002431 [Caulobacter sp. BE264]|nr:hypothetical protein [Caulobacter sp. BE264]
MDDAQRLDRRKQMALPRLGWARAAEALRRQRDASRFMRGENFDHGLS